MTVKNSFHETPILENQTLSSFFTVKGVGEMLEMKGRRKGGGRIPVYFLRRPVSWHLRQRWYPVCPQGGSRLMAPHGSASQALFSLRTTEAGKRAFFHSFSTRLFQRVVLSSVIEIICHLRKRKVTLFQLKWSVIAYWVFHEKWLQWTERGPNPRPGLWVPLLFVENSWTVF